MSHLITSSEAFQAIQAGKTVLCRHITGEFDALDQFPATVFAMQNYEFCIQVEMLELAGISFTKPLTIDEYREGKDVFVICTYPPSIYVFNFKTNALIDSINAGFVQRDAENAKLQLQALTKALGREIDNDASVTRLGAEPTKPKRQRKAAESKITEIDGEVDHVSTESHLETKTNEVTSDDRCQLIMDAIDTCTSNIEIENFLHDINDYKFSQTQLNQILNARAKKSAALSTNQFGVGQQVEEHWERQEVLTDLIDRASKAQSAAEANALFRYTKGWTQEQLAPLHAAVSRRLTEFTQPEIKEPPSLLVRIQNAADLTELDALEIDVSSRDSQIIPALMAEVYKRRSQLQNSNDFLLQEFT